MQLQGILLALLDIPSEYTEEYNRWYDLDHLPEHVAKGDVLTGRRYVAPRDLQGLDGAQESELTGGHPPYLTVYYLGGPDFTAEPALQGWLTKDRQLLKAGRFWKEGRPSFSGRWRLAQAVGRPSLLVASSAVPYVAHRGVIVAVGRAPSPQGREGALEWWTGTHLPDLFGSQGVLAALRFEPVDPAGEDLILHLLLCEDDPAVVLRRIEKAKRLHRATGRFPAHGGVYQSLAFLPYRTIVPLDYSFDMADRHEGN